MPHSPAHRRTAVRTVPVRDLTGLALRSPEPRLVSWVKDGHGLVGWGMHARLATRGPHALRDVADWYAGVCERLDRQDEVHRPGTGPVVFVSGAFDPLGGDTVAVVPEVLLGRDEFGSWLTRVGDGPLVPPSAVLTPGPASVGVVPGAIDEAAYVAAVSEAVRRIGDGRLDKVVLARDVLARAEGDLDLRAVVQRLATAYPGCWTYAVDGLVGATPELLVRLTHGHLYSRVLAGTEWGDGAYERVRSAKNRAEHAYAVTSAVAALEKVSIRLDVPDGPTVLTLPNVVHLATEIRGDVAEDVGPLGVVAQMHPTAAVGGMPHEAAIRTILELEGVDRGRYAGPVGWVDADGNGELGIALRGGELQDDGALRLWAGCGIVAGSDPHNELAESTAKLTPMLTALAADPL